ncbi:MAG: macro domain-containing protein [Myxococcales bacterium]|nr:macro domain-containing protein [Myxococcales bacterium]
MPAVFVRGDLFADSTLDALAHGCNCAGAMGKGIAVEFRKRFPRMFAAYKQRCEDGLFTLGDVFVWKDEGRTIFNLGTQKTWKHRAELDAIEKAMRRMVAIAEREGLRHIGLPRIGAGLGGLVWEDVRRAVRRVGEATTVRLVVVETYEKGAPIEPAAI